MNEEQVKDLLKQYDNLRELMTRMNADMIQIKSAYHGLEQKSRNLKTMLADIEKDAKEAAAVTKKVKATQDFYELSSLHITQPNNRTYAKPTNSKAKAVKPMQTLKDFFKEQGLEVVDKRPKGGKLWITGDEESMRKAIELAKENYGATGGYASGRAIQYRWGWYTDCSK